MANFTLNRNFNLIGKGHNIKFVKGETTWVPPELVKEAVGIGATPLDGPIDVLGPEDQPEEVLSPQDKEALFFAAFDDMIASNQRDDFEGTGKPAMAALKEQVKFSFSRKERDTVWQKYKEMKAGE